MENAFAVITSNRKILMYFLLGCCGIAAINCWERPDYNIFVYLFIVYTMFFEEKMNVSMNNLKFERLALVILFNASIIIDYIWLKKFPNIVSGYCILFSWIEILLKLPIDLIIIIMWQCAGKDGSCFNKGNNEQYGSGSFEPLHESNIM